MPKMQMLSSRDRTVRLMEDAALLCAALMLSYVEAVFPLTAVIPLPGAKCGLANLSVMLAYHRHSLADAAAVSFARVLLSAMLFGSVSSLAFSLSGAVLSLAVLGLYRAVFARFMSFIGLSVLSAAAHNLGQILCAVVWMHTLSVLSYLPVLLLLSVIFGTVSGVLMNLAVRRVPSAAVRRRVS